MTSRASDLKKITGHPNYYMSGSGVIYFKQGKIPKFSTGKSDIKQARKVVEERLLKNLAPAVRGQVMRRRHGILNPLVKDMWDVFLETKIPDISNSTRLTYVKNWKHGMEGFWGNKFASDVTDHGVIQYKAWYMKEHPTRHAKKTVIHFRGLVNFMVKQRALTFSPDLGPLDSLHSNVEKRAQRQPVGRIYSESEVQAMIDACDKIERKDLARRAKLGILLGARCGLRKNEALQLKWENVNLKAGVLKVWSAKNHKWRDVPILKALIGELRSAASKQAKGQKYIFPMASDQTRPISSQNFDKVWVMAKELAEIEGRARFHDLRHTFATRTAEANWPPVLACEVLDQSLSTYQKIYCKPSTKSKAEWMERTFGAKASSISVLPSNDRNG